MVDSYEIYGEPHDDSEVEAAEEMARIAQKRGRGKTSSGRPFD